MGEFIDSEVCSNWDPDNFRCAEPIREFTVGDTVHAWHWWNGLEVGIDVLKIYWQKYEDGNWVTRSTSEITASYSSSSHHSSRASIFNTYGAGNWRCVFCLVGWSCEGTINFVMQEGEFLEITNVSTTLLEDYKVKFDITWIRGTSPYTLEIENFGDGESAWIENILTKNYSITHTYPGPDIYDCSICIYCLDDGACISLDITIRPNIQETINWEASVLDHGVAEHTFWLISYYAPSELGSTEQEVLDNWYYVAATPVTTSSMSRIDETITTTDILPGTYSCVTMIAEGYNPGTGLWIDPIYNSRFDSDVIIV